jgi:hypothetical protein
MFFKFVCSLSPYSKRRYTGWTVESRQFPLCRVSSYRRSILQRRMRKRNRNSKHICGHDFVFGQQLEPRHMSGSRLGPTVERRLLYGGDILNGILSHLSSTSLTLPLSLTSLSQRMCWTAHLSKPNVMSTDWLTSETELRAAPICFLFYFCVTTCTKNIQSYEKRF